MKKSGYWSGLERPVVWCSNLGCLAKGRYSSKDGKKLCPDCRKKSRLDPTPAIEPGHERKDDDHRSKEIVMELGVRVLKTMGVRLVGTVIGPVVRHLWSDGTYRYPESGESPVWVRWDDGSMGWVDECFLEELPS